MTQKKKKAPKNPSSDEMDAVSEVLPGSPAAKMLGCGCPIDENRKGKGFTYQRKPSFWVNGACWMHGDKAKEQAEARKTTQAAE